MPMDRLRHPRASMGRKTCSLTDLEYRVWDQFQLSADDFGIMRFSATTIQDHNDALSKRPARVIQAALARLVEVGLAVRFQHQGREYICDPTWDSFQKIEYARLTILPRPQADVLAQCDPHTQELLTNWHPGGKRNKRSRKDLDLTPFNPSKRPDVSDPIPTRSEIISEQVPTNSLSPARAHAETANGLRQTADGKRPTASDEIPPPLIGQWDARRHGEHIWCAYQRPALCVTRYIHEQVMSALGGPAETRHDRAKALYAPAMEALGDTPASDDALNFWRNVVQAQVPQVTSRVTNFSGRGARTVSAFQQAGQALREKGVIK